MRDLVALSALPAVWAGYRPPEVAQSLADVLLRALRLDLVYIRVPAEAERQQIEVARTARGPSAAEETRDICRALAAWLDGAGTDAVPPLPNPVGPGMIRIVVVPVGCGRTDGVLVAGSRQAAFPSEEDRLLLSVAANQAAAVLQRERDEDALRESEERYRSVIAAMHEGVVLLGADGLIRACNASAERILGLSAEEIMGRTTFDPRWHAIHEDGSAFPGETHPVTVTLTTGRPCSNVVMGVRKPNGELIWISINSQPLFRGNEPTPYAVVTSFSDITERKNAEEALRDSEHRWRILTEALPQLVWTATPDGALEYSSAQTLQYMGLPESELLGWGWVETLHPDDRERTEQAWRAAVEGGQSEYEIEHRLRRFDGTYRWFKNRGVAIRDSEGNISKWFGTCTDITTDKQLEEDLRLANERMELAVRGSNVGVWDLELPDGDYHRARRYYVNMWEQLGYPDPPAGSGVAMHETHPDDRAGIEEAVQRYLAGETNEFEMEARFRHRDGSYHTMLSRGAAVRDAVGKPLRFIGISIDITKLRLAEEALRESEQRWRSLTEALPQLVWSATPDGACDYFSAQWTEHTGVAEAELLGWRWLETLHPEDREPTRQFWLESVAGRRLYDVEYRVRSRRGQYRWFKTRGVPIRDGGGNIVKWFGTCTDITDLRQTEEALRESGERFRGTFENAAVGIAHTHLSGRLLRVNEKFCDIVGYTRAELLEMTFQEITHPDDLDASVGSLTELLYGESQGLRHEKRYVRKNGSPVWVELFTSLQRDAAGKPAYAIAVVQDISERKRLDAELRQAKEAAEAANRAKDEFLANVSHEIRTPMNAILGMTDLALETELTEDQRQSLRTVKSAADSLLSIINDLLDFAKIEAGKLELAPVDFSLRAAVGDSLRALAVRAHTKGLELACNIQPDVPDALLGDAGRLRQVLLNLIGNAIKFTERGEVEVRVSVDKETRRQGDKDKGRPGGEETAAASVSLSPCLPVSLSFEVRDTGIGIPPADQERIFRAFEQEDTSTTRRYGGTGLGLTIASRLVALMGGEITVDSEPSRGSTFAFTARFGRQVSLLQQGAARPPLLLKDLPVLIVDDNATNRRILEEWLRGWQMKPAAVAALTALDALTKAVSAGRPYALVLLDVRMPGTDGLTLAAKIRERAELSAMPIIVLTSGDRHGDQARLCELRVDAHLLKPVQQDELLRTICQVLSIRDDQSIEGGGTRDEGAKGSPSPSALPLRVLVAEDNEFNAQLLELLLGRRGHRVRLASNGREALRLAREGAFDLLLLDVHMPELDGLQVVRAIRARERTVGGHLPIIALTARSRKEDREECLAAGMDDFLAKPIQAADLWAAMDRILPVRLSAGLPGLLDPQVLLAACGDDAAILERICQAFRAQLPGHLKAVQDAMGNRDARGLREAAHKLSGMVGTFSTVAGGVASELEDHAAQGEFEEARALMARLETMADELMRLADGLSLESLRDQPKTIAEPVRAVT